MVACVYLIGDATATMLAPAARHVQQLKDEGVAGCFKQPSTAHCCGSSDASRGHVASPGPHPSNFALAPTNVAWCASRRGSATATMPAPAAAEMVSLLAATTMQRAQGTSKVAATACSQAGLMLLRLAVGPGYRKSGFSGRSGARQGTCEGLSGCLGKRHLADVQRE